MVKQYKIDEVKNLVEKLQARKNIIFTDFTGVKVEQISDLRRQIREKNAEYKVIKNNLFKRALKDAGYAEMDEFLKGPIGVAFANEEISEVAQILKAFAKENKTFSYSCGVIDDVVYGEQQIKKIADLPSKEVLLSQIMSLLNGPGSSLAMGMNQVMASLARGIKAVAEQDQQ